MPVSLSIPEGLHVKGNPGAYIVQARNPLDNAFRSAIRRAGGSIVSFIPNNAYLVQASLEVAARIQAEPGTQAVLPYEPYYKLKGALLKVAVDLVPLPEGSSLKLLLFPGTREQVLADLQRLGGTVIAEERSPFGPVLRVRPTSDSLPALAGLPGVQEIEIAHSRVAASDLSRVATGVAADTVVGTNYMGLTGTNVLVNINDTGIDTNHPDLMGRIVADLPSGFDINDTNGHGTHVAGIIAGNGAQSLTVTNAPGSVIPGRPRQFRGMAPAAQIFAMDFQAGDYYLQEKAAQTNAFISNNSWNYEANEYDLAAASYDAAVRDALPEVTGSQPLLFVFPAGNAGALNQTDVLANYPDAQAPDTILSPGTAKNVITVGAVEQPRQVTNFVTTKIGDDRVTTVPWASSTDSGTEVAFLSARGNVGIGVEGEFGRFKPDVVAPGSFVISTRSANWNQNAYYAPLAKPSGNAVQVLSNLNGQIGPFYRYESGCSMAAAEVSGTLALIQEFFSDRLHRTNSPALMKALLVNGARPLGQGLGLWVTGATNHQGWGMVDLTNTLPYGLTNQSAVASPMLIFDQSPAAALATAEERVLKVAVAPAARSLPLRITLTWTDPPANPLVGVKLVNDLDLVVTNLSNGNIYLGNDIVQGGGFNQSATVTSSRDFVNNLENVFLQPPLAANYAIAVKGTRVNVNAVSARSDVAQDYALVISSGNGEVTNALALLEAETETRPAPALVAITNMFPSDGPDYGGFLVKQSAGGNSPTLSTDAVSLPSFNGQISLGSPAQWRFYAITNELGYTNAAFFTFQARPMALVQFAPGGSNAMAAGKTDADVDLYVSTDYGLTNLDPAVIATAAQSLSRGGCELVVLTNALPAVYYLGVKCEDANGAEFSVAAIFTEQPFSETDADGNLHVRGVPASTPIPDGGTYGDSRALIFAIADCDVPVHRVLVTNTVTCVSPTYLSGTLSHRDVPVVLNNATQLDAGTWTWVFDDSAQLDVVGSVHSAGPGSLRDFVGGTSYGAWILTQTVSGASSTNDNFGLLIEQEQGLTTGMEVAVLPGACREDLMFVPVEATNLTLTVGLSSGSGPVLVEFCPVTDDNECLNTNLTAVTAGASYSLDMNSDPPLHPGTYVLRLCNSGADPVAVTATAALTLDAGQRPVAQFRQTEPVPIIDDGLTTSTITVTNVGRIAGMTVGVGIEHPRVSDLEISLLSPAGTRVLMAQNRGGLSTEGLGLFILVTNVSDIHSSGGPAASTNVIDTGRVSGTVWIDYWFYSKPDEMHVYYGDQLIFDSGMVPGSKDLAIPYGPGNSTTITVIMNEGGNYDPETLWDYTLTSTRVDFLCAEFTENTNLTLTPIKFAIPPFTNAVPTGPPPATNGIYFLPEGSLDKFNGEIASGDWRLEIRDTQEGATNPAPTLMGWQLAFVSDPGVPIPLPLSHGIPRTETVRPGHLRFFVVDVPLWASFTTNSLLASSAPVSLLFNPYVLPFGTNGPGDFTLISNSSQGVSVLGSSQVQPAIRPGESYFLSIQNTGSTAVTFTLQTEFDIPSLQSTIPSNLDLETGQSRYFSFDVSPNALWASVLLTNLTANAELVLRKGVPLPTLNNFDYGSFNSDTNPELIRIEPDSSPVPLSAGRWYAGIFNADPTNLEATIVFAEFAPPPGTIVITDYQVVGDSLCVTWISLAGHVYQLQGRTDLLPTSQWITLSPVVPASGSRTSTCVPFSLGLSFFRVCETPLPFGSLFRIQAIEVTPSGVRLQWLADANASFLVEWSPSLENPSWSGFSTVITSPTGAFEFTDDGTESGGLEQPHFYRLVRVP